MKNQFIITVAFIAITGFTNQLFAQAPAAKTADWDLAKGKGAISCSVVSTEEGCSFNFTKIEMSYRDAASGLPTGKRQHKPFVTSFNVSSSDNSVSEVKSPRDAASGLPTGKRQHKPMVITKELDKSSPMLSNTVSNSVDGMDVASVQGSGGGAGKVSMQDFHFTISGNGKTINISCPDGSCDIPTDLPDGQYTLSCDWSWGMTQSGSGMTAGSAGRVSPKRCAVDFLLDIENGTCMAINEKGLPGDKKPTTKK
jgi:hypothetical protein